MIAKEELQGVQKFFILVISTYYCKRKQPDKLITP